MSETSSTVSAAAQQITSAPEFYSQGWFWYVLLAAVFLIVAHFLLRRWALWLRLPIWSLLTAGALTPAATISIAGSEQTFYAPAIVVAVFGLEKNGLSGAMTGLVPIVLVFLLVLMALIGMHWLVRRFASKNTAASADANGSPIEPRI